MTERGAGEVDCELCVGDAADGAVGIRWAEGFGGQDAVVGAGEEGCAGFAVERVGCEPAR